MLAAFSGGAVPHPPEFLLALLQELSLLQDRVPAFNSARAVATIEQELGMPLTAAFRTFDREPIAAASLGQVSCCGTL